MATPITVHQRRAALDRANESAEVVLVAAEAVASSLGRDAAARLAEAAEAAWGAVGRLRDGSSTDLGLGLRCAVALTETVEDVAGDLSWEVGAVMVSAAADVLDPLIDVAVLGLGRPLPWLRRGGPAHGRPEVSPRSRALHPAHERAVPPFPAG